MRETMRRGTPARLLSWLLALALTLSLLPAGAWAEEGNVTVTVKFDYRSVATADVLKQCEIAYPTEQTVTVSSGSTVYTVLEEACRAGGFSVTYGDGFDGSENGYVTALGDIGEIQDLCASLGVTYSDIFQYAGWTYTGTNVDGWGIQSDKVTSNGTITFRYEVYSGYMTSSEWSNFDGPFVDAYYGLQEDLAEAKSLTQSDYTQAQWTAVQTAVTAGENTLQTVQDNDAGGFLISGMMLNYIAQKGTALWGTGSPTDQLEQARAALERAVNKVVAPTSITLSGNNVEIPLNRTYQLTATVLPDGAPQEVTYDVLLGEDAFTISESGLITPLKESSLCMMQVISAEDSTVRTNFTFKIVEAVPEEVSVEALLTNISNGFTEKTGEWYVIDMGAYALAFPDKAKLTAEAKQTYLDTAIAALSEESVTDTTCAKTILALQSQGIDPRELYPVDSGVAIDAVAQLNETEKSASAWNAPYTLAAYQQGDYESDSYEQALVSQLLENQSDDGCWSEYGTIDTTANVITGLSFYYDENETVEAAVDQAITYLSNQQRDEGTYDDGNTGERAAGSNANSTAMVVIALAAMGIDPDTDARFIKNGNSVLDGLLSFALTDSTGFGYTDNAQKNDGATEQAFRALIAASRVMEMGEAYNIYDFSANAGSLVPGYASSEEQPDPEPDPPAEGEETVEVTFTLRAVGEDWLSGKTVEVDEGASAFDVFTAAIAGTGITYEGGGGYISSVTCRGTTLSEFDGGANAGWMYRVNGVSPDVGMGSYTVSDGDAVLLYYTADWTAEPDAGGMEEEPETPAEPVVAENSDGSFTVTLPEDADGPVRVAIPGVEDGLVPVLVRPDGSREVVKKSLTEGGAAHMLLDGSCTVTFTDGSRDFDDVAADAWYAGAVDFAVSHQLFTGTTDTTFEPETALSRAMLTAVLYQLEGAPEAGESTFPDVAADSWYADAAAWVQENGLMAGTERGFEPDSPVTREQIAAILYQYARLAGLDTAPRGDVTAFTDGASVSPWAEEAVSWALGSGLLAGSGDGTLSPGGQTTRAEGAAMLRQMVALLVRG